MDLQYYAEVAEALAWMHDRRQLLASTEVGKDEDTVQSLQRKLEALDCEVTGFKQTIERLSTTANDLIDRQHFDSANIAARQVKFVIKQTRRAY